ncbi:GDSL-type esterase/lipase family protein [Flavobacterium franklandianum]|uniref:G-D-S-L family lipolytic protein n=2 Tax=Flavobacterium TaxID=237 RepID=A0A553CLI6_9FLAO|nr:GDSL-type esterase/lipase family protein [Flavobacterium franklandianum]TRX21376.1 G-D-S-L family lipolytic protein [Flavobacterium franklandianum]
MKNTVSIVTFIFFSQIGMMNAQKTIPLYQGKAPGSENWNWQEKEMFSETFQTQMVYNVSQPTLTVYEPNKALANGTAVIVCPGGGFHTLSINSEGIDVAKWLNSKGTTAFVLKYRLVKSETDDPVKELFPIFENRKKLDSINAAVVPLAIADGLAAIQYVRDHSNEFNIQKNRIGIIGFSAGGTVALGTVFNSTASNRPDFAAPIYAYTGALKSMVVPADAPPIFIAAASDDQLGLAPNSVKTYSDWLAAGKSAELHIYSKGGHGFGMRKLDLPVESWIERFGDWLELQGLLWPEHPTVLSTHFKTQKAFKQYLKEREDNLHNDWAFLKRYELENKNLSVPKPNENRVVFLGNSIFENWKVIDSAWFAEKKYLDRGISGQTTGQTLVRFKQDVINLKPALVVINGGTNDIAENTGPYVFENTLNNINSMVELAKANNIRVILTSVLPAYDFAWKPGLEPVEKIIQLNNRIKEYASKNKIVYLDYYSPLLDEKKGLKKEFTNDGVHPTLAGYKVMEPLTVKAIEYALKIK